MEKDFGDGTAIITPESREKCINTYSGIFHEFLNSIKREVRKCIDNVRSKLLEYFNSQILVAADMSKFIEKMHVEKIKYSLMYEMKEHGYAQQKFHLTMVSLF